MVVYERSRHTRGIRDPQRRHAGAGFHQQRIDVAVVAAFKLDGEIAAGKSARDTQRAHSGLRAGVHQAHHFDRRHDLRDELGEFYFPSRWRPEARTGFESCAQSFNDRRRAMTEQQRTPRADVIDI